LTIVIREKGQKRKKGKRSMGEGPFDFKAFKTDVPEGKKDL